uniref:Uncharacterized protein n=1 Tax=Arundo donax TaxID=35708 RepID=A0A0A9AQM4_ARUDO
MQKLKPGWRRYLLNTSHTKSMLKEDLRVQTSNLLN